MPSESFEVRAVGRVESPLDEMESAPRQGDEGAPDVWIEFDPDVLDALVGVEPGDRVVILSWLDRADREVLTVHPRGDASRPPTGVFATRSHHRPNPVGLHPVEVLEIEGPRVKVSGLEALDGTPVIDVKPVLEGEITDR
ncbi:MAG TPA: tRNA (N6-threonylcarbamoyladenosine(37)-N6)-methyltransferase TrmO [Solirubrobacterales bacterium]|nr:tRNA (N6-threonylcarbamoyladenosine(37)-N6)-methyltransferase TrmO [Solirubrobacterales bacterium]